jgi:hypothetical protein
LHSFEIRVDTTEGRGQKKAEGRRQKAEGRRQKAEGRRQKAEEGRRQKTLIQNSKLITLKTHSTEKFTFARSLISAI